MIRQTMNFCFRFRWVLIAFFLLFTLFWAAQIPKNRLDPDMMNQLPRRMESRISNDKIESRFGGTDMIMVMLKTENVLNPATLGRVIRLSRQMKTIQGIEKVWSLSELKSIKGKDGTMLVTPIVKEIPADTGAFAALREDIMSNDSAYGTVVSKDFTVTGVIGLLGSDVSDEYIVERVRELIARNPGNEETVIGGVPYNRINVARNTRKDMGRLLPIGLIIMILFLFLCFGQLRGVVLPFLVVIMSIAFTMGIMPFLGWKVSVVMILLPILLIAIANDYGIHMIAAYQEKLARTPDIPRRKLVETLFTSLGRPVLLAGITTIAGMLCLTGHILVSARQLGILSAAGILLALFASLFFIGAMLFVLPKEKAPACRQTSFLSLDRILGRFSSGIVKNPGRIVAVFLIVSAAASFGIFRLNVDTDPLKYYRKDHPVVYSSGMARDGLGGIFNITLNVEGDIRNPDLLKKIDRLEKAIEKIDGVSSTSSIARVVRHMSRALYNPYESGYNRIPETRNAVSQFFELYSMSGDPEDFEKLVDFSYRNALINIRIRTTSTPEISEIIREVRRLCRNMPEVVHMGGIGRIFTELANHVVRGQVISLVMALLVVALLIMLAFRSVTTGLILIIPLAVSIPVLFGLMGWAGIPLDMINSLLSSIMIGVGIDYTIHFYWRYREERARCGSPEKAVETALKTTGKGIVYNAFSVIIGFVVLLISNFMPVRFFGFLVTVTILICLLGALLLIPAIILKFKPHCLDRN